MHFIYTQHCARMRRSMSKPTAHTTSTTHRRRRQWRNFYDIFRIFANALLKLAHVFARPQRRRYEWRHVWQRVACCTATIAIRACNASNVPVLVSILYGSMGLIGSFMWHVMPIIIHGFTVIMMMVVFRQADNPKVLDSKLWINWLYTIQFIQQLSKLFNHTRPRWWLNYYYHRSYFNLTHLISFTTVGTITSFQIWS